MCGIAGAIGLQRGLSPPEDVVRLMTDALAHRGPDGGGMLVDDPVVLGHRRLAILDLSPAGHQPMATPDESLWITYNGEIYNYVELGNELRRLGHVFRSACDTEVLLHAYAQWGVDALPRLNGMFAFAIWDRRRRRLFCARDRFGVKPFYYAVADRRFIFASEIKALLLAPGVPRAPREDRVREFLAHGLADHSEETMFEGIRQLRPGHYLDVDADGGPRAPRQWYELRPAEMDGGQAADALRETFVDAVRLRLRSDVTVGTCLSGGVDSSSVVAVSSLLRREAGVEPPMSFTARTADPRLDESGFVRALVDAYGIRNETVLPNADDLVGSLDSILWQMDEPFHGPSVYGHWKLMELARTNGVTVLLDGQGGDEVFGGYHHMYPSYLLDLLRRGQARTALTEVAARASVHGVSVRRSGEDLVKLLLPASVRGRRVPPWLVGAPQLARAGRHLADQQRDALTRSPLPAYLHHEDRNSMSFSLEARVPFLDYRLAELGLALGPDRLLRDGRTKAAMRDAMRGLVPDAVLDRAAKQGFTVDHAAWLKGPLGATIARSLEAPTAALADYVDPRRLELAAADAAESDALWRTFAVERWLRLYFAGPLEPVRLPETAASAVPLAPGDVARPRGRSGEARFEPAGDAS